MDYKIKFEYKGIGKQAAGIRQRVLQQQKQGKTAGASVGGDKATLTAIKGLNTSINKLIASNNKLASSMGGGRPGSSPSSGGGGGSAGFGRMGASIPIVGAAIAGIGFAVQKINQVGNAYLGLVGQQKGTVGVAGFQRGRGMYLSGEMGAGMKSYAMQSGKFADPKTSPNKSALDIGGIYGLSASETLGQAGMFKRTGANYGQTTRMAFGSGVQTELPALMTGISGELEEAVKNGINTSDMSKDIGTELLAISMKTGSKSISAGLGALNAYAGTKKTVGEGGLGGISGIYTARAGRKMLMGKMTGSGREEYLNKLIKSGDITEEYKSKVMTLGEGATFQDLMDVGGSNVALGLQAKTVREQGKGKMAIASMRERLKSRGGGSIEDMYRSERYIKGYGNRENYRSVYKAAMDIEKTPSMVRTTGSGVGLAMGGLIQQGKIGEVETSLVGAGTKRQQGREALQMKYGATAAKTSLQFEKVMIQLANKAAPGAVKGMEAVGKATEKLTGLIDTLNKKIERSTDKKTKEFSIMKFMGFDFKMPSLFGGD